MSKPQAQLALSRLKQLRRQAGRPGAASVMADQYAQGRRKGIDDAIAIFKEVFALELDEPPTWEEIKKMNKELIQDINEMLGTAAGGNEKEE